MRGFCFAGEDLASASPRQLVAGEDRAGRDGELRAARLALEDAAAAVFVDLQPTAAQANRLAVIRGPAHGLERVERFIVGQAHDLRPSQEPAQGRTKAARSDLRPAR